MVKCVIVNSLPQSIVNSTAAAGHRARLRERFLVSGFEGFAPHEALELLLTLCIPRRDVKPRAKALLERFGDLKGVLDAPVAELGKVEGLGAVAPVALKVVRESAALYLAQQAQQGEALGTFEALEQFWRLKLGGLAHEEFHVAFLDNAHRLLKDGLLTLEKGVPNQAVVYPRKVMEAALRRGASAVAVAHNHPSGDPQPSLQDRELTRAIQTGAQALQLRLVDHVIVGARGVYSFRKEGLV